MKLVTLRPAGGLNYLKVIIVVADLVFLALPLLIASIHGGAAMVAVFAVFSVVCIVAGTFLGWLGLRMHVEVEPDAVRIYYFMPRPVIIPRGAITDVQIGTLNRGSYYAPRLVMVDGRSRIVAPLAVRTEAVGQEQVAKLRVALRDVAPAG
jgi:hypothetical protein